LRFTHDNCIACRFSDEEDEDEDEEAKHGERGEEVKPKENTLRRNFQALQVEEPGPPARPPIPSRLIVVPDAALPPPPSRPLPPTPKGPLEADVEDDDEEEVEFVPKKRHGGDGTMLASDPPRPLSEVGPSRPLPPTPEEGNGTLVTRRPPRGHSDMPPHGARTSVLPDLLPLTSADTDVSFCFLLIGFFIV